jgi:HEXXH motif-containing protein
VSPVVDALRPMTFVFHGSFAFAQDLALTERLLPRAPSAERASMERYLDEVRTKVAAAFEVIEREAEVTEVGAAILSELAEIVGR